MDDGRERALSVDGDQGGLLVLIEPTPVTMPRHYATLRALPRNWRAQMFEIYNRLDRHMRQCSDRGGGMRLHTASPPQTLETHSPPSGFHCAPLPLLLPTPHCDIYLPIQGL